MKDTNVGKTRFKSFNPKRFSRHKGLNDYTFVGAPHSMKEFCAKCGFPYGAHYGEMCPKTSKFPHAKLK